MAQQHTLVLFALNSTYLLFNPQPVVVPLVVLLAPRSSHHEFVLKDVGDLWPLEEVEG